MWEMTDLRVIRNPKQKPQGSMNRDRVIFTNMGQIVPSLCTKSDSLLDLQITDFIHKETSTLLAPVL